jgi:hypothetical protein
MYTITQEAKRLDWLIARTLLCLEDPCGEKYAQSRIIEALNFACLEVAMQTELIKDEVDMQLQAQQPIYNIPQHIAMLTTKHPYAYPLRIGYEGATSPAILPVSTLTLDAENAVLVEQGDPQSWTIDLLSYGEISIQPIPQTTGNPLSDEIGNVQVTYAGMPFPMADPLADYPDPLIPGYYHEYLPFVAAALILDEAGVEDMKLGDQYRSNSEKGMSQIRSDGYNQTSYQDVRPM